MAGEVSTLDGGDSYDPDGSPLSYRWTQTAGPRDAQLGTSGSDLQLVPALSGFTFRFTLSVDDGALESAPTEAVVSCVDLGLTSQIVGSAGDLVTISAKRSSFHAATVDVPNGAFAGDTDLVLGEISRPW